MIVIRPHFHHRFQITNEGLQLGIVWGNVNHHIEFFTQFMGFINAELQVFVVEFVVAYAQ